MFPQLVTFAITVLIGYLIGMLLKSVQADQLLPLVVVVLVVELIDVFSQGRVDHLFCSFWDLLTHVPILQHFAASAKHHLISAGCLYAGTLLALYE